MHVLLVFVLRNKALSDIKAANAKQTCCWLLPQSLSSSVAPAEEADAEASLMDELDAEPAKKKRGRAKKKAVAEDPEDEEGSE